MGCPSLIMIHRKELIGCALPMPTSGPISCDLGMGSGCTKGLLGHSTFRRKSTQERGQQMMGMLDAGPTGCR